MEESWKGVAEWNARAGLKSSFWSFGCPATAAMPRKGRTTTLATSFPLVIVGGRASRSMFGWLVADGWCWFVLREEYCWLVADGWFVVREKYCWLVADKPSEQGASPVVQLTKGATMMPNFDSHFCPLLSYCCQKNCPSSALCRERTPTGREDPKLFFLVTNGHQSSHLYISYAYTAIT
jgi:hypothetical protein